METVGDEAGSFLLDVDRRAAEPAVELYRCVDGCVAGAGVRHHFDQRHEVRRVEGMADEHALGVLALCDELGAGEA